MAYKTLRCARRRAGAFLSGPIRISNALLVLILCASTVVRAESADRAQMQSLDEQVQEIKSDVLRIAAELTQLEEKLLYPSSSQVAVFVSLPEGETIQLDSVAIRIDDEPVAHHLYTFKEVDALQKGGIQRIYTGNLPAGEHRIAVDVAGKRSGGSDLTGTQTLSFRKEVEPKLLGITVAGRDFGDAAVSIGSW